MDILVKAVALGVAGAVLALLLKKNAPELALLLAAAAGIAILCLAAELFQPLKAFIEAASSIAGLSGAVLGPVLKCVGIGIAARLGADVCRDAEAKSVASAVELVGAACAVFVALPLMTTLLDMVGELI